jgi:ParB family chromosome partitioning protein
MTDQVTQVSVSKIRPGDNDRKQFERVALEELAESIQDHGLAQPITLRPVWACPICGAVEVEPFLCPHGGSSDPHVEVEPWFEIVAGERRFRAVTEVLGWSEIPALIRELDDEAASAIMLAENVHRQDLNPMEEALAYQKRIEQFGWSVAEVARRANVSDGKVRNRLSLLALIPDAQHLVATGALAVGFGERMAILDPARQQVILKWLRDQTATPTLRTFTAYVNTLYEQQAQETMWNLDLLLAPQVAASIEESGTGKLSDILPTLPTLPDLPQKQGSIGQIIDAYVARLLEQGETSTAQVLIDFWVKAMRANYAHLSPFESRTLAALAGAGS